jgi:hypothetical protein
MTASVTRNEAAFDPGRAYASIDRINSDTFFGAAAGQAKVEMITGRSAYHAAIGLYWQVTYDFLFDPRGFKKSLLNQGLRAKDGSERRAIRTKEGQPVSSPVPLDDAGAELAADGDPVFLDFTLFESIAFSGFAIPGAT